MSTSFASLKQSHNNYSRPDGVELYRSLGWEDAAAASESQNVSAVRLHLALLDAGVAIPGRMPVLQGRHQGKAIEANQSRLADRLTSSGRFGDALVFNHADFMRQDGYREVAGRTGIVSFQRRPGYAGGYIDLLDARSEWNCLRQCYFNAGEIRFWQVL